MLRVSLDTDVLPADDLIAAAAGFDVSFAVCSVTQRETEGSSLLAGARSIEAVLEVAVLGESRWGEAVWGSSAIADILETTLAIISNGSFPKDRSTLSRGQQHQLRDAMILEAHIRSGRDILVSNDRKAFFNFGRREALQEHFGVRIMTSVEFEEYLRP